MKYVPTVLAELLVIIVPSYPMAKPVSFHRACSSCCLSSRSSGVDSDRANETKKKKKKKRQRDSEQLDSGAAHRNRGNEEERKSHKRAYDDIQDTKNDEGVSPEKRRRTEDDAGRSDHLQPSNHISPPDGPTYRHLNGYKGITHF